MATLWLDHPLAPRTVTRTVEEIGRELAAERDTQVADFTHHRRHPEGVDPEHELAVVFVDGGRVQLRDEDGGAGVENPRWAEDKIARLQTMTTACHPTDPCPELPACFARPILGGEPPEPDSATDSQAFERWLDAPAASAPDSRWQPEPLARTCVGTMRPLDEFRWMVQAEATRRHFFTARRKAFVADGSAGNWPLHARHFADFVPILDFVHAAEYLHAAAKALASAALGGRWVTGLWQGRSEEVLASLRVALDGRGVGAEPLPDDHELRAVQRAWTYLSNASDKLDYPRYRRDGLPCTSSLVESQVKEFNGRLKGSEKFWHESNAEAMLEIVCWTLRDDGRTLADYFRTRPTSPFRRSYPQPLAA